MEDYQNLLARLINSATPTDQQKQKINSLLGLLELGANTATSSLAGLGGGLSYLGALPAGNDAAQHVKRGVENSLTYQPQTEQANRLLQLLAQSTAPFVKSGTVGAQTFADNVYNTTGSPLLGAAARTAPTAIDQLLNRPRLGALGEVRKNDITAYHGSPHDFDKFDMSKIGTGEGAQVYGHGLYFADAPDVAEGYRIGLSYDPDKMRIGGKQINDYYSQIETKAARMPSNKAAAEYDKLAILERLMGNERPQDVAAYADELGQGKWYRGEIEPNFSTYGRLYTVDIPDQHIDMMIDWDKPINQQKPKVLAALDKAGINTQSSALAGPMILGQERYLADNGITGVRYKVEGSDSYNSVLFDDSLVKILKKE